MQTKERQQKIDAIRSFPATLRQLVGGLTEKQRTTHFLADEWTVAQIVHHCADSHINSYVRNKLILTEDNPPIKPYAEPDWATMPDGLQADFSDTMTILEGLHARWTSMLQVLTEDQWARVGTHGDLGEISVDDLLTIYDDHCRAHLDQIRRVLSAEPNRIDHKVRRAHIRLMRYNVATLGHIVSQLSQGDATTFRDSGDGWTVLEVLCHIRDFDGFFRQRVDMMLNQEHPTLPAFDHDQIAIDNDYNSQDLATVMQELSASRAEFVSQFYELDETPEKWLRSGVHPEAGDWTILDSLIQVGHHDANHIEQITRILSEKLQ